MGLTEGYIEGILMTMYRLHIDVPIHARSLDEAQDLAKEIMNNIDLPSLPLGVTEVNYRLGHDEDRQRSNYLDIDERGHCSHRKSKKSREGTIGD